MLRVQLLKNPIIKFLSSIKLSLVCLLILAVQLIFGTIYQSKYGLYLAQKNFFDSLFILDYIVPLPSVTFILIILFINLSLSLILVFQYKLKKIGLWLIHLGNLILLIGGFYNLYYSQESLLQLSEGELSNISQDYYKWLIDIEYIPLDFEKKRKIQKYTIPFDKKLLLDEQIISKITKGNIVTKEVYKNGQVFDTPFAGIIAKKLPTAIEEEANFPLIVLANRIEGSENEFYLEAKKASKLELESSSNSSSPHKYKFKIHKQEYKLPIAIQLIDVKRELHKRTQVAKSYQSKIKIFEDLQNPSSARELTVAMNKPFRYKDYTFFQSSYGIRDGQEFSALAVVRNKARLIPYISGLLASLGLLVHFIMQFYVFVLKKRKEEV